MKKRRFSFGVILLLLLMLAPATLAQAKTTAKKLFEIRINDGYATTAIPVYEYTTGSKVSIAAKSGLRTVTLSTGAKTAKVSLAGKTSYFGTKYQSVRYANKVTLSASKTLTYQVRKKSGGTLTFKVTAKRPAKPAIKKLSLSAGVSKAFTTGSGKITASVTASASVKIQSYIKVTNSSGKLVYQSSTLSGKGGTYQFGWDGKASASNKANLAANSYVPSGTYTVIGYVKYQAGSKWVALSKKTSCKITTKAAATTDSSTSTAKTWNWKVYLTGDDTLDYLAETICQSVLKNGMTETERARALYQWCMRFTYASGANKSGGAWEKTADKIDITSSKAKTAITAYGKQADQLISSGKAAINNENTYFVSKSYQKIRINWGIKGLSKQTGDCLIMALSYEILCRHAGLSAGIIENSKSTGQSGHHFWNAVSIGGKYYLCDVNQAIYEKGYTYFLRGTSFMNKSSLYNHYKSRAENMALVGKLQKADCPTR